MKTAHVLQMAEAERAGKDAEIAAKVAAEQKRTFPALVAEQKGNILDAISKRIDEAFRKRERTVKYRAECFHLKESVEAAKLRIENLGYKVSLRCDNTPDYDCDWEGCPTNKIAGYSDKYTFTVSW